MANTLPKIESVNDLANYTEISAYEILKMSHASDKYYKHFTIKKSNGKNREIFEPNKKLKSIQHWILKNILEKCELSVAAKAYVKGVSLKENADLHCDKNTVITMDIKDFFPSISIYNIQNVFKNIGYAENISWLLANLCCYEKALPQGAPTSPYLSNLYMKNFDSEIIRYAQNNELNYTRYADDITFSGNIKPSDLIKDISRLVYNYGFIINPDKTRVCRKNAKQEVTGIVVNEKMQVSKEKRKLIRQQMYYIEKYGLESHLERIKENRKNYVEHLFGQINFALFVNPQDKEMEKYCEKLKSLL